MTTCPNTRLALASPLRSPICQGISTTLGSYGCLKMFEICNDPHIRLISLIYPSYHVLEVVGPLKIIEMKVGQNNNRERQRLSKAWRSCSIASVALRMASRGLSWTTRGAEICRGPFHCIPCHVSMPHPTLHSKRAAAVLHSHRGRHLQLSERLATTCGAESVHPPIQKYSKLKFWSVIN